ncbi:MAG: trehalose-6-phosphate synthase [Candidatus Diapherotrites archaeon]|nr:trehalose-6-phosphate synthase [Candidatus Diapherotrites archaeon]
MNSKIKKINQVLQGHKLLLASSSEPYVHFYHGGEINWRTAVGGVATAFDAFMSAYGGTWVALGLGTADANVIDNQNNISVPPNAPAYTLKRVMVTSKEEEGFLALSSNTALWPLSHVVYVRPQFSEDAWLQYRKVNQKLAEALSAECTQNTAVWLNDYHLSLCAQYFKKLQPNVPTGFFWHIPWPSYEIFKICPWHKEILEGLLGADLIGFHTQGYVKNFLYTVEKTLSCKVDWQNFNIQQGNRIIKVRALPIGTDSQGLSELSTAKSLDEINTVRKQFNVLNRKLLLGVDRMDYTKGLPEKMKSLDILFTRYPELVGKLTLVQIAAPTRTKLPEYVQVLENTLSAVDAVNWKYAQGDWKPIVFLNKFMSLKELIPVYKTADVCLVTSLHDGMNLVSKEYIAANSGEGALILSKFAGSAEQLTQAIQVNPFLVEDIAIGIKQALDMPVLERQKRMTKLKKTVMQNTVFGWATDFLQELIASKL